MWRDHTFNQRNNAIKRAKGGRWTKFEKGVATNIVGVATNYGYKQTFK